MKRLEPSQGESLTPQEEQIIRDWLIEDGDTLEGAQEVVECCRNNAQARDFFLRQARAAS